MFVNSQKGSHGMFSKSGKRTLEKFQILLKKDEIINGIDKKVKVTDFYTPDQANNLDTQEDEFKVYSQDPHEKQNLVEATLKKHKAKIQANKMNSKEKTILEGFKSKKHENPPCNKYNPNWDYPNKKLAWGIKWKKMKSRDFSMLNKKSINPNINYNLYKEQFKIDGKVFLDFGKQIHRHTRSRQEAKLNKKTMDSENEEDSLNKVNSGVVQQQGKFFQIFLIYSINWIIKHFYSFLESKTKLNFSKAKKLYKRTNAPDFDKVISREQLENIYGDKRTVIPFTVPKFGAIWASKKFFL